MKNIRRKIKLAIWIILVSTFFTNCNKNGNSDTSSIKLIEPEQLVSMEEASAITANVYTHKNNSDNAVVGQKLCDYDNEKNGLFQVGLTQQAYIPENCGLKSPKAFYDEAKLNFSNNETINGLGDEAFYCPTSPSALHIMCSGYYIHITIIKEDKILNGDWKPNEKKVIYFNAGTKACENLKKIRTEK